MLAAMRAVLFQFEPVLDIFFIFPGKIINSFAFGAFEFNHVVLRHIGWLRGRTVCFKKLINSVTD